MMSDQGHAGTTTPPVSFRQALAVWVRVAGLSFGGPAGQIAVMHRIIVEEQRWIGEARFLHALNYCMLLPGPEAQQLAIYIGWLMHRTRGGLVAGTLFVLPGVLSIMALSWIYVLFGRLPAVEGLFFGLKAAVLAIVLAAVARIGRKALRGAVPVAIAAAAFLAIFAWDVPFPWIIATAGAVGLAGYQFSVPGLGRPAPVPPARSPEQASPLHPSSAASPSGDAGPVLGDDMPAHARPNLGWSLRVTVVCLVLWLAPVLGLRLALGSDDVFSRIALFFSEMAVVTFGGAYAVLAYVAQRAVESYGWLTPAQMLDGLGMAETTPGPLIMVLQFVGFMAAWREPGGLPPLLAGTLAGLLATWVTFVPCFLWIFLGAPFIESLRGNRALASALSAITAAVVGVMVNLALWFSLHLLFGRLTPVHFAGAVLAVPVPATLDPVALALTVGAVLAVFCTGAGMAWTLAGCAVAGMALWLMGWAGKV
jgi:chromate transporter